MKKPVNNDRLIVEVTDGIACYELAGVVGRTCKCQSINGSHLSKLTVDSGCQCGESAGEGV